MAGGFLDVLDPGQPGSLASSSYLLLLIFVDTGAWFAMAVREDFDHAAAMDLLASNSEPLVTRSAPAGGAGSGSTSFPLAFPRKRSHMVSRGLHLCNPISHTAHYQSP